MPSQTMNLSVSGLHTYNNPLSGVPKGALKVALNASITRLNVAECRRGFSPAAFSLPLSTSRIKSFLDYESTVLAHYDTTLGKFSEGSGFTSLGTLNKPTGAQETRSEVTSKNLYITDTVGIKKLDGITSSLYSAGLPKGTMMTLALLNGGNTAVEDTKFVTYRYLIGRKDATDNLVLGGVSGRYTIENTGAGATRDITVTAFLPSGLDTSHFVQVYRSLNLVLPGSDELYLVYEINVTAADITAGFITFADIVPDDLTGATIYTSPSQEGILQDNNEPPLATDLALYQNHLFFSDVEDKHRFSFDLIGCGSPDGLQVNDVISITDGSTTEVYTAKATEVAANDEFFVDVSSGSFAVRIADTAASLVKVINIQSSVWVAFLESTGEDIPGKIRLQAQSLGATQFETTCGRTTAFSPPLGTNTIAITSADTGTEVITSAVHGLAVDNRVFFEGSIPTGLTVGIIYHVTTVPSTTTFTVSTTQGGSSVDITVTGTGTVTRVTDAQKSDSAQFSNGLSFSKRGIPEAVPIVNNFLVGNSSRILRIKALRDSLFIFKETDGIFVLRGDTPANFTVTVLDDTALLVSEKSLQSVNNQIYALFEAGVGQVTDTGVRYISVPIKDTLLPLYSAPLAQLKQHTFGVAYETEGKYILALPSSATDTTATQQFIWDVFGRTWVKWDLNLSAATVATGDGKLYIGKGNSDVIQLERKAQDFTDFTDEIKDVTISAFTGTLVTLSDTDLMTKGDLLEQGELSAYIESIDLANGQVTIDIEQAWTLATADVTLFSGIDFKIEWNTEAAGNPAGFKQFYEANILFQQQFTRDATIFYYSDTNPGESSIEIEAPSGNGAWGQFAWGEETWGGEKTDTTRRFAVTRQHSRCNTVTMRFESRVAHNEVRISGASLLFNQISTRTAR